MLLSGSKTETSSNHQYKKVIYIYLKNKEVASFIFFIHDQTSHLKNSYKRFSNYLNIFLKVISNQMESTNMYSFHQCANLHNTI